MSWLRVYLPIIAIILLGFGLRIHDLEATPLRGDEAFSALYWSNLPLSQSLEQIAPLDPHPPLSFIAFRLWALLLGGIDSVFSLRFLSVLGNTLGMPALFALGALVIGRPGAGLVAALIWALHPYEIWHSQDYRNYALWAGISVIALWLGLRLLSRRHVIDWLLYALAAFLAAMVFYAEVFNILALAAVIVPLARRNRAFVIRLLALQFAIVLVAGLAFALLQARAGFIGAYGGNLEAFAPLDYFTRFLPTLTLGDAIGARLPGSWLPVALLFALASLLVWKRSRPEFATLMPLVLLPLLLIGAASLMREVFNPRYALNVVPALVLLLVAGAFHGSAGLQKAIPAKRALLALGFLSPWFALAGLGLHATFNDDGFSKAPAWDEMGDFLNARVKERDLVIQLAVDPAFGYYYRGAAPEMALPVHSSQPESEIIAELEALRGSYDSVYVVAREQAGWANAGVVERWMGANLQEVLKTDASGLPVRQYMEWGVGTGFEREIVSFGGAVALAGYEFFEEPLPTGELLLWLYWKPLARKGQSLKSFVHVYGDVNPATGSPLWSQDDIYPQHGRLDSRSWLAGEVFRAAHYLPTTGLAAGEYQISVGWYDPVSGARLSLMDGADAYALGSWTLAADDAEAQ